MKRLVQIGMAFALSVFASGAQAQMTQEVHFEAGNYGTLVSGTITGNEYYDYLLGAGAGQEMFAEITVAETNGDGVIYFNILPPGSDGEAIFIGSMETENYARITLPEDGQYTIRVYLMGNDEDSGKTVSYNLDLSIQ
ncbi:hypothetical protein [Sinisalibacter aestuarii]|uniref:DNA breaking-rejoining protein n=1 Tax=Sinisalibacter aestuarii TaxID=2949426 RepID=A0ABQ5LVS0_9RHOB|nr:hypothetical protein [Sinisalibacter aestuarii]GKY89071.1 hypothetical protein STA1M1_29400 [Sinisalibacter aestuarii]